MEIDKEILKGHIDTILLSLLREKPVYGYELARTALDRSEGAFELKEATLYLSLKRLEKNELVTSFWGDSDSGGGRRKYYELTETGRLRLKEKKAEWLFFRTIINQFMEGIEE
ncbi:PadR family transcriptional regulator [Paenibacillus endoradicis]|uniref:PadR family transcriptional regulator n=1 Tax=Paenibacillus endoradicis TaxID=2972487 RepID=UPI0021596BD9|nr:PadR family transcriptional regulator [Paenibacillus endoradicis]MCR8656079.1 PadR family transcriptional regulator [Paenibacillus endoradicis]MCR8658405.1 PadR family transcriptional regulator [Paenibacillus endoradicis]